MPSAAQTTTGTETTSPTVEVVADAASAAKQPTGEGEEFDQAASQLNVWYPAEIASFVDVVENSYNWRGPEDASARCEIGFAPAALLVRGELHDDVLFNQTLVHPAMPDWWRITYGADGLELAFDDPTSAAQHVRIALNFGCHAVEPQVELLASPLGVAKGPIPSAVLKAEPLSPRTARFQAIVPYMSLADPRLFAGPLRMTVRLHDMDGAPATYLKMEKALEKN